MRVDSSQLPAGWDARPLGEVVVAKYGKALPQKARRGGDVAVYGSNGQVGSHDEAITSAPVIVIGRKGSVGAVNYSDAPVWPIDTTYFVDEFTAFDPRFLSRLLQSLSLDQMDRSTAIPGLSREQLYEQQVVVPPISTQKRIADWIDDIETRRASIGNRLTAARKIVNRLHFAVLAAACSGRLTADWREDNSPEGLPPSWSRVALGDLVASIRGGSTEVPSDDPTPFPILRSSSVRPFTIDYADVRYLSAEQSGRAENFITNGDLLVTRLSGSLDFVGNAARVQAVDEHSVQYPDRLFRVRLADARHAEYLEIFMASQETCRQVAAATRSAAGHQRISISDLRAFEVNLPPLAEQQEIVRRARAALELAAHVENAILVAASALEKATRAALRKAFRGELIPSGIERTA